jgi:transcriptional regulator with PAS, ATPase and Fis domain
MNAAAKTFGETHISSIDLPKEYIRLPENGNGKLKLTTLTLAAEEHILNVMKTVGNSVQRAAPLLGVSERTLQRRLKAIRERRN